MSRSDNVARRYSVELIIVGNELVNGTTLDTNSHWLAKRLNSIGATVTRKTTIEDEVSAIGSSFNEAIDRKPRCIISVGGLGPTFDDMTLNGLSKAIGQPVVRDGTALKYLKDAYARRNEPKRRLSRHSLKMAEIPKGTTPLWNPVGSAPAVLVEIKGVEVLSLPGVPKEMKAIFNLHVLPRMKADLGDNIARPNQIFIDSLAVRESKVAPYTERIMSKFGNDIYVKSHTMGFDSRGRSMLRFQLISTNVASNENEALLKNVSRDLQKQTLKIGGSISRVRLVGRFSTGS